MPDAVETMAYTNEVPWHGLGVYVADAPTVEEMIVLAGLDWVVNKVPMMAASKFHIKDKYWSKFDIPVPGQFSLIRSSDKRVLDVVGSSYKVTQPAQAMNFFHDFVEEGDATLETAGSLRGGRLIWGLADLKQSFTMYGKDRVDHYLLIACPYEQGKALITKLVSTRIECGNTISLSLSESGGEFRMTHREEFDERMMARAREVLGLAREDAGQLERNARILRKLKLNEADAIRVITPIMSPREDKESIEAMALDLEEDGTPRIKRIMDAYHNAPGAQPGTGWGALNAVTYWSDHMASRTKDSRLTNAWFGRTARQKVKLLNALLEMAA